MDISSADDLHLALHLADLSDSLTLGAFRTKFSVRTKADQTPVSEIDEQVEKTIRAELERERPGDAIVGEEFGNRGDSARRWIIDPIDATKNYIRGIPIFATLIALDGRIGVVSAPGLRRRWWATKGGGAFCNGDPIGVSKVGDLKEAQIGYDSVTDFPEPEKFLALVRRCGRSR
ncbi:MAG TPA: inositol monophosphatase family protein, partial [Thermoanaerobaculia bacterium]